MAKKLKKITNEKWASKTRRARRIRSKVAGSSVRPRLCVTRTNRSLILQLIDDDAGKTLLSLSTDKQKTANVALATELGKSLAQKAVAQGISSVVFDRGGRIYHGRVAAVAAGAREGGLSF